jgi:hypothetical protein
MYQDVVLIFHWPGEDVVYEVVRARPAGRAYVWSDKTTGAVEIFLLYEGENGQWFVQRINHFPDPPQTSSSYFIFQSFADAKRTFPDRINYILFEK